MSPPPVETIVLSQQAKDQLIRLKRRTGIKQWNVLCRWAFCLSLADPSPPPQVRHPADSSVEMTWKVFGGKYAAVYAAMLRERCATAGLGSGDGAAALLRLHVHRGIAFLDAATPPQLCSLAMTLPVDSSGGAADRR